MRKGEKWERVLEGYHKVYESNGLAAIFRAHPGVRMLLDTRIIYEEAGPPDFFGFLPAGAVIFDAKEVQGSRFPYKNLKKHQAKAFAQAEKYGAFAFLAIRCADGDFVVPWAEMRDMWAIGKGSFVVADHGHRFDLDGWYHIATSLQLLRRYSDG